MVLFDLLDGSIFVTQHFSTLLHFLLLHMEVRRTSNESGILSQVVNMTNPDFNYIFLCSEIIEIPKNQYKDFKLRLAEILLGFLITEKSLSLFQSNVKRSKIDENILKTLALAIVYNKAAYIILCFLVRDY